MKIILVSLVLVLVLTGCASKKVIMSDCHEIGKAGDGRTLSECEKL